MSMMQAMMGLVTGQAVGKSKLLSMLLEVGGFESDWFTPLSWDALSAEVVVGQDVYDDPAATKEQVDDAILSIENAISLLKDRYFSDVSLLLPFTGTEGQRVATDLSPRTKTPNLDTGQMLPILSSDQAKFGDVSALFDGSDTVVPYTTVDTDFNLLSAFTVEFWVYLRSIPSDIRGCWIAGLPTDNMRRVQGEVYPDASVNFYLQGGSGTGLGKRTDAGLMTTGSWHFVAQCKDGDTCQTFIDGIKRAEVAYTSTFTSRSIFTIGRTRSGSITRTAIDGFMQQFRVTKGVARYSGDFTPFNRPFPTS